MRHTSWMQPRVARLGNGFLPTDYQPHTAADQISDRLVVVVSKGLRVSFPGSSVTPSTEVITRSGTLIPDRKNTPEGAMMRSKFSDFIGLVPLFEVVKIYTLLNAGITVVRSICRVCVRS